MGRKIPCCTRFNDAAAALIADLAVSRLPVPQKFRDFQSPGSFETSNTAVSWRVRRSRSVVQLPRDDQALDLRGSFVDLRHLRVAEQPLDREVLDVAVTAEDLDRLGRHPH